jgi:predicted N-acetyltransferase YhbS
MIELNNPIFDHLANHCLRIASNGNFRSGTGENKFLITGFPSASYNYVFLTNLDDGLLETMIVENIPFVCYLHHALASKEEVLEKYGMTKLGNVTGHELTDLSSFSYIPSEKIEIKKIISDEDLAALDNISHICFKHEQGFARDFLHAMLRNDDCEMFLAFVNGNPVGTGILSLINDEAGLYRLAVLPEYRKVGVGSELVKFRINRAKEKGYDRVFSQNFEASKSMFRKLGFRPVVDLPLYVYVPKMDEEKIR